MRINYIDNISLLLGFKTPLNLTILKGDQQIKFNDTSLIKDLYKKIKFKWVKRVPINDDIESWENRLILLENDSEKRFSIDNKGRIRITLDKGNVRNRSWLHWLWWKHDKKNDSATTIVYLSNSDSNLIEIVNKINSIIVK